MTPSTQYDLAIERANSVLAQYRACKDCPVGNPHGQEEYTRNWCCHGCKHHSPNGCTVEALFCKLWLCSKERAKQPQLYRELVLIKNANHQLLVFRGSKEESLRAK